MLERPSAKGRCHQSNQYQLVSPIWGAVKGETLLKIKQFANQGNASSTGNQKCTPPKGKLAYVQEACAMATNRSTLVQMRTPSL